MNLFDDATSDNVAPLAARMRPRTLQGIVGQDHLTGPESVFRKAFDRDQLPSMILHGPAGTGKSTIARIIAHQTEHDFQQFSAVNAGVSEIREAADDASERLSMYDRRSIVFIDEIHRLNKTQQDQLLPHIEEGTFTLIGATTENPYFCIVSPLLSRCRLFTLNRLSAEDLKVLVRRALQDEERGLGNLKIEIDQEAVDHLVEGASGDARVALNSLELAITAAADDRNDTLYIGIDEIEQALQQPVLKYDRAGDEHYDTISAFIKSMRGSDPDAAVYWLAKMLQAGEDPRFIARRLIIQAAEDVGLADPTALRVAVAAADAVEYVGLPEAQIPLSMAAIHLATAPKSNSAYTAIARAREHVENEGTEAVPPHLAGGQRPEDARDEYLYPHDYPKAAVAQQYMPDGLRDRTFYTPGDNAREQRIREHLEALQQTGDNQSANEENDSDDNKNDNEGERD